MIIKNNTEKKITQKFYLDVVALVLDLLHIMIVFNSGPALNLLRCGSIASNGFCSQVLVEMHLYSVAHTPANIILPIVETLVKMSSKFVRLGD